MATAYNVLSLVGSNAITANVESIISLDAFASQPNSKEAKELLEIAKKQDLAQTLNAAVLASEQKSQAMVDELIKKYGSTKNIPYSERELLSDIDDNTRRTRVEATKATAAANKLASRAAALKSALVNNNKAIVAAAPSLPANQQSNLQRATASTQNFVANALANSQANRASNINKGAANIAAAMTNVAGVYTTPDEVKKAGNTGSLQEGLLAAGYGNIKDLMMLEAHTIKGKRGGTARIIPNPNPPAKISEQVKNSTNGLTDTRSFRAQMMNARRSGAIVIATSNKVRASEFR